MTAYGLGTVDVLLLATVVVSAVVGIWRGLVFEAASLVGWLVAYGVARLCAQPFADHPWLVEAVGGAWGPEVRYGIAFAVAFVLSLMVWALLARLLQRLIHATPLAWPDRLGGLVFGLLRGVVLLLALATLVSWTPWAKHSAWQSSRGCVWLEWILEGLKPFWSSGSTPFST